MTPAAGRCFRGVRWLAVAMVAVALGASADHAAAAGGSAVASARAASGQPAPTLTGRYPLGARRLCCRTGAQAGGASTSAAGSRRSAPVGGHGAGAAPRTAPAAPTGGGSSVAWVVIVVTLALVLLALGAWRIVRLPAPPRSSREVFGQVRPRPPRPRHPVAPRLIAMLSPLLRYSVPRDAYVLRLVGNRHGPVLVARAPASEAPRASKAPRRRVIRALVRPGRR